MAKYKVNVIEKNFDVEDITEVKREREVTIS